MKTVAVTSDAGDPSGAHRRALAAALAQQGGLGFSGQQAAPAVAGNAGLALALGNLGVSAAQGIMAQREADKQAAATEAARGRFAHMVGSYAPGVPGAGGGPGRGPSSMGGAIQGAGSSANAATAYNYYLGKGLPEPSARALVGGFQQESGPGLNTGAVNKGDGSDGSNSIGIGQWNSDRAAALRQFAAAGGRNPGDLQTQLDFSWQELNGPEKAALTRLMAANDDRSATAAAVGYERPAGWSADNPEAAVSFGKRLANTTALASLAGDPGMSRTPSTPAGQLAATPGSTVTPAAMPNSDPGMMASADVPAPNAQPAMASGLPADMQQQDDPAPGLAMALGAPQPNTVPASAGANAALGVAEAQKQGDPSMMGAPSPYGIIPPGTGDASAQSLATALGAFNSQPTPAGTDTPNSGAPLPGQTQPSIQAGTTVGVLVPSVRDASNGMADAQAAGMPSFTGLPETNGKRAVLSNSPDMGPTPDQPGPSPVMAGADVPLPPVRPSQAMIDALGGPSAGGSSSSSTPSADPNPTGSIDMGSPADMPAPNARPAIGMGTPASAMVAALSPLGKNAGFETPQAFNLAQSGGSPSGGNAAMVAALGGDASASTAGGVAPAAATGGAASPFRQIMDGGDLRQVAAQQDARLNGQPSPQGSVMANALGGGPAVIPAPAGAPAAQAGGWQQDAALILSDPYAAPEMKAYAKDLLEKSMPQQRALQSVTGPDGQLWAFDPASGGYTKGPEGTKGTNLQHMEVNGRVVSFDPSTGATTDVTPAGLPSGYRPATAEERKALGVQDGTGLVIGPDGKPTTLGGNGPTVNVDTKAENAEAQARGQGLGKRFNEIAEDGTKIQTDAIQYQRLGELLGTVNTGPKSAYLEKVRQVTGVALDPNTDQVQALGAAIQHIAPSLRVPGSGAQSDMELKNFMNSIPNLMGTKGGNTIILNTLQGMLSYRQQRAQIAQQWQTGDLSAKEAQKQIDALPSPFQRRDGEQPAAPQIGAAPVEGARQAPDGKWYVADPNRPGKYLQVNH